MDGAAIMHAFFDAIETGDMERFRSLYSADALIWHNVDRRDQTLSESIGMHEMLKSVIDSTRYTERRYISVPGGAVGQHVVSTHLKDGQTMNLPVMLRLHIEGGRIQRVEEYFDAGQAAPLIKTLAAFWPDH